MAVRKQSPRVLSNEYISDSSSSSDSGGEQAREEDENSPASESDSPSPSSAKVKKLADESASDEDSQSEVDKHPLAKAQPSRKSNKQSGAKTSASKPQLSTPTVTSIPTKPFKAPKGFYKVIADAEETNGGLDQFLNLEGQQIWHITAPASLPISALEQFSLSAIGTSTGIVKHRGHEYGIIKVKKSSSEIETVLQPVNAGSRFKQQGSKFEQSYQIHELPQLTENNSSITNNIPSLKGSIAPGKYVKPVRQQPKGLKQRYTPFGTDGILTEGANEDNDLTGQDRGFRMPLNLSLSPEAMTPRKRKQHEVGKMIPQDLDEMDLDVSVVPESSIPPTSLQATSVLAEASPARSKEKKHKKSRHEDGDRERKRKKKKGEASQEA